MSADEFVLSKGLRDTRGALERWKADPWPVLRAWGLGALAVASTLLAAVWVVALASRADLTAPFIPGIDRDADPGALLPILAQNALVLALHATACVAGFIAGSSLALAAESRSGLSKWVHEKARPIALGWVVIVTLFSLVTQAYALGLTADQIALALGISPGALVLTVLPHALPELVALFLPLAAWTIASRRDEWQDLLAATFATVAIAIPVLVACGLWRSTAGHACSRPSLRSPSRGLDQRRADAEQSGDRRPRSASRGDAIHRRGGETPRLRSGGRAPAPGSQASGAQPWGRARSSPTTASRTRVESRLNDSSVAASVSRSREPRRPRCVSASTSGGPLTLTEVESAPASSPAPASLTELRGPSRRWVSPAARLEAH